MDMEQKSYSGGEIIFSEGDDGDSAFLVASG
ncbi:MAG: cyclic nucleotide-binding protein, partial [Rhodospirillaceae bacterium]|nr:cyclic nucleotide-binding protein [Rhodospirillaceae bacterium]